MRHFSTWDAVLHTILRIETEVKYNISLLLFCEIIKEYKQEMWWKYIKLQKQSSEKLNWTYSNLQSPLFVCDETITTWKRSSTRRGNTLCCCFIILKRLIWYWIESRIKVYWIESRIKIFFWYWIVISLTKKDQEIIKRETSVYCIIF
jgi:hypothetical protein